MPINRFTESILAILEHFDHELKFFVKLAQSVILFLLELLFDLDDMLLKHFSFIETCFDFLLEDVLLLD